MTLHLLRDIPREIRDQIYSCVLASPSGCVSLQSAQPTFAQPYFNDTPRVNIVPVDPESYENLDSEPVIRLTLLRICSQIHLEARHALWRHNSLAFPLRQSLYSHSRLLDPRFSYRIESVHLGVSFFQDGASLQHPNALRWAAPSSAVEGVLKIFGQWAREGSLRSLTLVILPEHDADRGMALLNKLLESRGPVGHPGIMQRNPLEVSSYKAYLAELEKAGSYLPKHLKRKMVLNTSWDALDTIEKSAWFKERAAFQPQGMIREIHDKFGGEFWMDGKLCFRNYEQAEHVFDTLLEEQDGSALSSERRK